MLDQSQNPESGTRHQQGHLQQLERVVRQARDIESQSAQEDRKGTGETQTDVCKSRVRESGAEECERNKILTPSDKRATVLTKQETHGISSSELYGNAVGSVGLLPTPVVWQVRDTNVIEALNDFVETHPRCGLWK